MPYTTLQDYSTHSYYNQLRITKIIYATVFRLLKASLTGFNLTKRLQPVYQVSSIYSELRSGGTSLSPNFSSVAIKVALKIRTATKMYEEKNNY